MVDKICFLVGAGEFYDYEFAPKENDLVIAVDGGLKYLKRLSIEPSIVIGDFDSLGFLPNYKNVIKLNTEKNETDMFAAARLGLEKGFNKFHIYGGVGGRFDHSFANIQLVVFLAQNGAQGLLIGQNEICTAITDGALEFPDSYKGYASVFAYSGTARGVNLRGLKYELYDATVYDNTALGVSNEFIGMRSLISVKEGTLIVIYPNTEGVSPNEKT